MIPGFPSLSLNNLIERLTIQDDVSVKVDALLKYFQLTAVYLSKECIALPSAHKTLLTETASHLKIEHVRELLIQNYPQSPRANAVVAELLAILEINPLLLSDAWECCDCETQTTVINKLLSPANKEFLKYAAVILRKPAHIHNYLLSERTPDIQRIYLIKILSNRECLFFRRVYCHITEVGLLIAALHKAAPQKATLYFLKSFNKIFNKHEQDNTVYPEAAHLLTKVRQLQEKYECEFFDLFCFQLFLWLPNEQKLQAETLEESNSAVREVPSAAIECSATESVPVPITFSRAEIEASVGRLSKEFNARLG